MSSVYENTSSSSGLINKRTNCTEEFLLLFSTIARLNLSSISENSEYPEEVIRRILTFYMSNKNNIKRQVAWQIFLIDLPNFCFDRHIDNSETVVQTLKILHQLPLMKTQNPIVLFLLKLCEEDKLLPLDVIEQRNSEGKPSFSVLTYFLHHAYVRKATFDDKRLAELIESADPQFSSKFLFFSDPYCILNLIQFGLRLDHSTSHPHPIFISGLNLLAKLITKISSLYDQQDENELHSLEQRITLFGLNLRLLILSTCNPQHLIYQLMGAMSTFLNVMNIQNQNVIFSMLFGEDLCFETCHPASLRHACRHTIRSCLQENWMLPYGVWKLGLCRELSRFLNFTVSEKDMNNE